MSNSRIGVRRGRMGVGRNYPRLYFKNRRLAPYTAGNFLIDVVMLLLTAGLWAFWIVVREYRWHI